MDYVNGVFPSKLVQEKLTSISISDYLAYFFVE